MTSEQKLELIKAILGLEKAVEKIIPARTIRKHRKHAFKKQCDLCGLEFKGLQGLGIHRWKMHSEHRVLHQP